MSTKLVTDEILKRTTFPRGGPPMVYDPDRYWGDPSGNIKRMEGEQETIATVREVCTEKERLAMLDGLNAQCGPVAAEYTIIVNGRERQVSTAELSYEDVAGLAFESPPPGLTVTYARGDAHNRQGTLAPGDRISVCAGMVFNAADTGRA